MFVLQDFDEADARGAQRMTVGDTQAVDQSREPYFSGLAWVSRQELDIHERSPSERL